MRARLIASRRSSSLKILPADRVWLAPRSLDCRCHSCTPVGKHDVERRLVVRAQPHRFLPHLCCRVPSARTRLPKRGPTPGSSCRGRRDPPPSVQAMHAPSRCEPRPRADRLPRGAPIPRAFRASAICRRDVAPVRCNLAHDRDHVGRAPVPRGQRSQPPPSRAPRRSSGCRCDAVRLSGRQGLRGAPADERALLLRHRAR